jgi:hypothetical protein
MDEYVTIPTPNLGTRRTLIVVRCERKGGVSKKGGCAAFIERFPFDALESNF